MNGEYNLAFIGSRIRKEYSSPFTMIKLYLLLSVVLFTSALNAQVSKSIELTPGTLSTILSRAELNIITNLTLGGTIDARDFKTMRDEMQKLAVVDLSTVNVSAYTGTEGPEGQSSTVYPADEIPAYAFSDFDKKAKNKNLISITLPLSVTSIGNNVFANAIELREVSIPLGLISIGDHSFDGCMILNLIHIPATVIHIGVDTFTGCGARIDVDANNPFYSSLDGVLFNKSRSFLIHYPISGIGSYDLPTSVTSVNPGAFQECTGLIPGTIPSSVSPFQYGIFQNSQGQSLIILSDLEFGIFQNCSQQSSVTVPVSVDSIGSYAFYGCTGLTAVTIPSSVHFIGSYAFQDCTNLTAINAMNSIPPDLSTVAEVFTDVDKRTCKLYVPYHSSALYAAASQWKDFTNSMEMPGFTLSASTATVSATEGSAGSVDISSNVAWSAVSDQTWLTVTPASGTGDGTLTYTASANSGPMRSALITVSADGTDPKVVTIIQAEGNQIQSIAFNAGWNIISSDVIPTNTDMKSIFQPLIDAGQLRKVMDESGKTIENFGAFGGWKNNIGNINPSKGYKVNVSASSNLTLVGIPVQLPLDIALKMGWNIISFPSTADLDALMLVQSLINAGQLKKVMDERGMTIENFGAFGGWKNNIGNFLPGKGYKVNVTSNCILTIPSGGTKSALVLPDLQPSEHFRPVYTGNGTD